MPKLRQKIVLFIESSVEKFVTPSKIGNLFMNRFAIDENAATEIVKIIQLESWEYGNFESRQKEGV